MVYHLPHRCAVLGKSRSKARSSALVSAVSGGAPLPGRRRVSAERLCPGSGDARPSDWPRAARSVVNATKVAAERCPRWGTGRNAMVIAMLTLKSHAFGAVTLLLLLPDIALAQARSSV